MQLIPKLLLIILFIVNFSAVFADDADSSSHATTDSASGSDDGDDSDSIEVTGDSDDSDDDDSDDTDSGDSGDDSDDDDTDDDSGDSDDSVDSGDSDSSETATTSAATTAAPTTTTSAPTTTVSSLSYCTKLTSTDCSISHTADGNAVCAMNALTNTCYAVVASQGMNGAGNYDEGYSAAEAEMQADSQKLNSIVGVLAAIVVLLVLTMLGGGYFFYQKINKIGQIADESMLTVTVHGDDNEDELMDTARN